MRRLTKKEIRNHRLQKSATLSKPTTPCWMRKRIQKSYAILALLDGFQKLHLDCMVITMHLISLVTRRFQLGHSWTLPWVVTSPRDTSRGQRIKRERLGIRLAFDVFFVFFLVSWSRALFMQSLYVSTFVRFDAMIWPSTELLDFCWNPIHFLTRFRRH